MTGAFDLRRLTDADEVDFFNALPYALNHEVAADLEQRRRRPEWTWLAVRDGRLLGRLALWSQSDAAEPAQLDIFDIDESLADDEQRAVGTALLRAAQSEVLDGLATAPEIARYLPADWREHAASRSGTELRIALLEETGARFVVERLRLEWTPASGIPAADRRLTFRDFASDEEMLALTTRVLDGTLDAHSREDLAGAAPREVAERQFEQEFARYTSPRDWWRVALTSAASRSAS